MWGDVEVHACVSVVVFLCVCAGVQRVLRGNAEST